MTSVVFPIHLLFAHMKGNAYFSNKNVFGSPWVMLPALDLSDPDHGWTIFYEMRKVVRKRLHQPGVYPCKDAGPKA